MRAHELQETALRYFLEVARSGSLTLASERLHVAASALSRQIAGLEQALGTPLFERHSRGMVLNAAGEILAGHARQTLLDAERAIEDIRALQGLRSGRVRLAATEAFANDFLPRAIIGFRREHTGILFELNAASHAAVSEAVRNGEADIGLTFSRAPEPGIQVEYQQPSPVLVLMPPGHPLAAAESVTLQQMQACPLALPWAQTTLRALIDLACSRRRVLLEPVLTTNNMVTLHNFVLHGGGLAVSGEVSVRHFVAAGLMAARPLADPGLEQREIEVQTLAGRTLPAAVRSFVEHLTRQLSGVEI
ncbi:LysR family transcriptional regulator [Aquincola sp. S2]|uniref:LysR family transcriptional regulator n=1 Tax=Pseudaquabacterium terrae TaxID=2732868 RepID=A0ABX2EQG5_9BURK|nr:LysR family transcriptional regulator [Aquabacterium terrae]NRF70719.1 LysR family transcriptional regulator [Aquabacterium terrae]